jgi:hypothetical protein
LVAILVLAKSKIPALDSCQSQAVQLMLISFPLKDFKSVREARLPEAWA